MCGVGFDCPMGVKYGGVEMKKETLCPECRYPMEPFLIKKGGVYKRRIEKMKCECCGHEELKRSAKEFNDDLNI